ncbi:hypothetical protein BSKO_08785 [Bryopsis sp. KO-2023]|nr:hypothetical protein BSKO_08785 [Bryopsis sp. KO-2023]
MNMSISIVLVVLAAALVSCHADVAAGAICPKPASPKKFNVFPDYEVKEDGEPGTLDYKIEFFDKESGDQISPWHDIPHGLESTKEGAFVWVVNEIPKGDLAKMETMAKREGNPIQQDDESVEDADGEELYTRPRYYGYGPSLVNYGSIPQTWEDSGNPDEITEEIGDGDPLDSLDIGKAVAPMGLVYKIKILGALPLMDSEETDWKIVGINEMDPLAEEYSDFSDIPEEKREAIYNWFRDYKTAAGKGQLAYHPIDADPEEHWYSPKDAVKIIKAKNASWKTLMDGTCGEACEEIWMPET